MKYLFVHIAKTAGSSVNKLFVNQFGQDKCLVHIESQPSWDVEAERSDFIKNKVYLSGHRTFAEFERRLNLSDFYVFTLLRNPASHVISHIAWIRRLALPGEEKRFFEHPLYIQNLAKKFRSINFGSPDEVAALVRDLTDDERALLDNPQVRYLRSGSGPVDLDDLTSAIENLQRLACFGFVESFDSDLARIASTGGLPPPDQAPAENIRNDADEVLSSSNLQLICALDPLISFDLRLYSAARKLLDSTKGVVIGTIDGNEGLRIYGWARRESSKAPVTLDVYVNGEKFKTIIANSSRRDLFEAFGMSCAFDVDISDFEGIPEVVEVKVCGAEAGLRNSPFFLDVGR